MTATAHREARRHIRHAFIALLAGFAPIAAALAVSLTSGRAAGDTPAGLPLPEPDLSLPTIPKFLSGAGSSFTMLGADAAGDAFAYTLEPSTHLALANVGGQPVPSDWTEPPNDPTEPRFLLYQHTSTGGWHLAQEALDQNGGPIPGFRPSGFSSDAGVVPAGGVASGGAAAIAGVNTDSNQPVLLARGSDGRFRAVPEPPTNVLPSGDAPFDTSNPVLAPIDESGHKGVLVASPAQPHDVLHYDGTGWTQEPINSQGTVQGLLAISATSPSNAYLLAQTQSSGVALFRRQPSANGEQWVQVQLDGAQGSRYSSQSGSGYGHLGPLDPSIHTGAQPLTAAADGAWVDGSFQDSQGQAQPFTIYVSVSEQSDGPHGALHAWCDSATSGLCDEPLPAGVPSKLYRSFTWPGGGPYGSRIITGLPGGGILSLQGTSFDRVAGLGVSPTGPPTPNGSAAFLSPTEGWTGGAPPTPFTQDRDPDPLQAWPTPFRQPLTAIAGEPGHPPGDMSAEAVAVGEDGEVARYTPGQGWSAEPLLTSGGVRATPRLRSVAWPVEDFAYAVGDGGEMWRWERATGTWARDPATPQNFDGNLTGIAFDPRNPSRGYAVGLDGVLLRYDKTWTQEPLPAGLEGANFTSIAFAGSEAIAAFQTARPRDNLGKPSGPGPDSGLLVNDGSGWHLDAQEQAITTPPASGTSPSQPAVSIVAGLPDGGAIAAGEGVTLERDAAGAPWRLASDPLLGYSIVAAAAVRDGPVVRALLSVDPTEQWPLPSPSSPPQCALDDSCVGDQGLPTLQSSYDVPANGSLLRETATGWQDVQHNDYPANYVNGPADNPRRDDPIQALLIDPTTGQGWAVGGETGIAMSGLQSTDPTVTHLHTAGIYRYPAASTPPTGASSSPPPLDPHLLTVALGGGAACVVGCADRDPIIGLGPPVWLDHALASAVGLAAQPGGPRAFIYTGGIVPDTLAASGPSDPRVADEISSLAGNSEAAAGSLPFAPVISGNESFGGTPDDAFMHDFSPPALAVTGDFPDYYAFDVSQPGTSTALRVIVIDLASTLRVQGLANQNPADPQYQFLTNELAGARGGHIPAIVVGSRTLTTRSVTGDEAPSGAAAIAKLLVDAGASAYFFASKDHNVRYEIPAGASQTIPSYGTASLSYGAWASAGNNFGESGYLLASVDPTQVDPTTDRAPVTVRLIPNISELALDARNGTILRRSQVALFGALARRPRTGTGGLGVGNEIGPDPYVTIPPNPCSFACSARINPEYSFSSSRPDIADFVEHDPASANPRAVYLGADGRAVTDNGAGLLCAFNAGQTTVTVTTGGLSFSEAITVLGGSPQQPCGTRPLLHPPPRIVTVARTTSPAPVPPPTPAPSPAATPSQPPPTLPVPPPPPPVAPRPLPSPPPAVPSPSLPPATPASPPPPPPSAAARPLVPFIPRPLAAFGLPPVLPPLVPPAAPPAPPTGFSAISVLVTQPVGATEERREEEHATEEAQQFSVYHPDQSQTLSPELAIALVILLAGAGATLRRRGRPRRRPAPALAAAFDTETCRRGAGRRGRRRQIGS